MIKFRQKEFGILGKTIAGASIGASIGSLANKLTSNSRLIKFKGKDYNLGAVLVGGGTIVGAALGALCGVISNADEFISRKVTTDNRLMKHVVSDLKKTGFKEGIDFTRDPKTANSLKTAVCFVITKNSGELRVLINTANDSKLRELTEKTVKNIPNLSAVTKKASDRFNEITITTISDSSADVGLIAGLAEKFIRAKYPVYLIEVG